MEEKEIDSGTFGYLVVPYEGASASSKYLHGFQGMHNHDALPFGTPTVSQNNVWHINFFAQAGTKNELASFLP